MRSRDRSIGCWVLLAVSIALGGCGPPANVTVTGSVLKGGKPIALGPTGVLEITLVPDVGPNAEFTSYLGRCNGTGKFEVLDVPRGRYKVCIALLDPTPQDDKLQGAYSMHNTKIIRDVDGKTPIAIDLDKPGA